MALTDPQSLSFRLQGHKLAEIPQTAQGGPEISSCVVNVKPSLWIYLDCVAFHVGFRDEDNDAFIS